MSMPSNSSEKLMDRFLSIIGILLLGVTSASGASSEAAFNSEQLALFTNVVYSSVKSVKVAKLNPRVEKASRFHNVSLDSKWVDLDISSGAGLAELLKTPILFWADAYAHAGSNQVMMLMPFCVPKPGYAVHLETDKGSRDFVICLECGIVDVFGEKGKAAEFCLEDEVVSKLRAYYNNEFSSGNVSASGKIAAPK